MPVLDDITAYIKRARRLDTDEHIVEELKRLEYSDQDIIDSFRALNAARTPKDTPEPVTATPMDAPVNASALVDEVMEQAKTKPAPQAPSIQEASVSTGSDEHPGLTGILRHPGSSFAALKDQPDWEWQRIATTVAILSGVNTVLQFATNPSGLAQLPFVGDFLNEGLVGMATSATILFAFGGLLFGLAIVFSWQIGKRLGGTGTLQRVATFGTQAYAATFIIVEPVQALQNVAGAAGIVASLLGLVSGILSLWGLHVWTRSLQYAHRQSYTRSLGTLMASGIIAAVIAIVLLVTASTVASPRLVLHVVPGTGNGLTPPDFYLARARPIQDISGWKIPDVTGLGLPTSVQEDASLSGKSVLQLMALRKPIACVKFEGHLNNDKPMTSLMYTLWYVNGPSYREVFIATDEGKMQMIDDVYANGREYHNETDAIFPQYTKPTCGWVGGPVDGPFSGSGLRVPDIGLKMPTQPLENAKCQYVNLPPETFSAPQQCNTDHPNEPDSAFKAGSTYACLGFLESRRHSSLAVADQGLEMRSTYETEDTFNDTGKAVRGMPLPTESYLHVIKKGMLFIKLSTDDAATFGCDWVSFTNHLSAADSFNMIQYGGITSNRCTTNNSTTASFETPGTICDATTYWAKRIQLNR